MAELTDAELAALVKRWLSNLNFEGDEAEVRIARDIAMSASAEVAQAWEKKGGNLPDSAKWWIENRENIYAALMAFS